MKDQSYLENVKGGLGMDIGLFILDTDFGGLLANRG